MIRRILIYLLIRPRLEVRKSTDGKYYLSLKARNGEKLLTSETYVTAWNARRAKESLLNAL